MDAPVLYCTVRGSPLSDLGIDAAEICCSGPWCGRPTHRDGASWHPFSTPDEARWARSTGQGLATGAATCGNVHAAVVDVCGRSSSRMRRCSACCCQHHPASARSRRHVRFGVALSQCGTGSYNGAASGMRTAEKVLGHAGFVLSMLATPPLCCPQSGGLCTQCNFSYSLISANMYPRDH